MRLISDMHSNQGCHLTQNVVSANQVAVLGFSIFCVHFNLSPATPPRFSFAAPFGRHLAFIFGRRNRFGRDGKGFGPWHPLPPCRGSGFVDNLHLSPSRVAGGQVHPLVRLLEPQSNRPTASPTLPKQGAATGSRQPQTSLAAL